jgi:hypothetical protein
VQNVHLIRENAIPRDLSVPQQTQILRYQFNGNVTIYSVTRQNLLSSVLTGTTGTAGYRAWLDILVKKVEIWSPPSALGSAAISANLVWGGTQTGNRVVDDTVVSLDPAHIVMRPPMTSSAMFYSSQGNVESETLFQLTGPIGTVMDIHVIGTMFCGRATAHTLEGTTATLTAGVFYFNALDQAANVIRPMNALNATA